MGLQVDSMIKVRWNKEGNPVDSLGSEWLKTWDYEDLPELVSIPGDMKASHVRPYIEGRYGYQVTQWSYWSAIAEAARLADNLYSGDPV